MSKNFGAVDLDHLPFPVSWPFHVLSSRQHSAKRLHAKVTMSVDYIRVYQHKDAINVGCDPPDFPTEAYINKCVRIHQLDSDMAHDVSDQIYRGVYEPESDYLGGRLQTDGTQEQLPR